MQQRRLEVSEPVVQVVGEAARVVVGFDDYIRIGLPVTIATLLFGSVWLWFVN